MNIRALVFTASLALSFGGNAIVHATAVAASPDAPAVGYWLHDPQGNTIGSVRDLADNGRIAVLMIGSYYEPGSHEIRVPASALSLAGNRVTLRHDIVEAMNVPGR